jgi:hypothetical protein
MHVFSFMLASAKFCHLSFIDLLVCLFIYQLMITTSLVVFLITHPESLVGATAAAETKEGDPSTSEPVSLPEVVVMLDGKEVHHDEASSEPPEPEDDFDDAESVPDVEAQPKMLSEVREITVILLSSTCRY